MQNEKTLNKQGLKTRDIALIGMFTAVICICSWISVPTTVPFTLQTFAIFLSILLLNGFRGTISVTLYIILGAIGLPVFAGFKGGPSALFGPTGGYIMGFFFSALIMWLLTNILPKKLWANILSCLAGLFVCYLFGTLWFSYLYFGDVSIASIVSSLSMCVIPFIIPDLCKIGLAIILEGRLRRFVNK